MSILNAVCAGMKKWS